MTDYARAPQVEAIAGELIRDVEQHKALDMVSVHYVWRDKASKSHGRIVLAKARKIGGLNAFLAQTAMGLPDEYANKPFFVVEVASDVWPRLTPEQHRALLDHELCHLRVDLDEDGEPMLSIRGHDLEEFGCIVERHGLWKSDVAAFGSAVAEQLALAVEQVTTFLEGLDQAPPEDGESDNG